MYIAKVEIKYKYAIVYRKKVLYSKIIYYLRNIKSSGMLTKKTRYAMMALAVLAKEYGKAPVPMSSIAEKENIPLRFIEGILRTLKNRGILNSSRGKSGGYYLLKKPEEVSLLEIVQYFEGSVSMLPCACDSFHVPCEFYKDESNCPIRKPFSKIYDHNIEVLRTTTLNDLK
mgnify:FL=1